MTRVRERLHLEVLEDRRLLATCHVVRLGDVGAGADIGGGHSRGDLRYCINKANDEPGPDVVDINVTGTITLAGALPVLSTDIHIVGRGSSTLTVRRGSTAYYRVFHVGVGANVEIAGLEVTAGSVPGSLGGGILNQGTLTLADTRVTGNSASSGAGVANYGTIVILNSIVSDNLTPTYYPAASGGGIYNVGYLTLIHSTIANNKVKAGGNGTATARGGGIQSEAGASTTIQFSTIANNAADAKDINSPGSVAGGGIHSLGLLTIRDSMISGNTVTGLGNDVFDWGGGIFAAGNATISNSTISSNLSRSGLGGGILIAATGSVSIRHSTIVDNSEGVKINGELTLLDSIVANSAHEDLDGGLTTSGYNLIGKSAGGSGYDPTDVLDVDPLLGQPVDNGGPTQTIALLPGSPAIDAGDPNPADPPEWDQRGPGFPRIVNGRLDIGAFEVQATEAPALDFALLATMDFDDFVR